MASNVLPVFEKLSGRDNFSTWKFAMQTYLEHEELWECISQNDPEKERYKKKDTKAKAKIILSIDPVNYVHVQSAKTSKETWDNLSKAFDDTGLTRKVGLLRTLITTSLENCESVDDYVNKIISTAHKLRGIKFDINEEWLGTLLLAGLPDTYKPMIMGIESSGVAITSDSIKVKLLQDIKNSDRHDENSASFVKKKFMNKGPRCYNCNKMGHISRNCPHRSQGNNKDTQNKEQHALLTTLLPVVNACNSSDIKSSEWYVDSGATVHITNRTDGLENERSCINQNIVTADNNVLPVTSVGNVKLKIDLDDSVSSVVVKDAVYVPDITTNLLSVSKMTNRGHTVIFDVNKCRIFDKSNNLLATASNVNGMYQLDRPQGTFHGSMSVNTQDDSLLWHRRLGHPSTAVLNNTKNIVSGIDAAIKAENSVCSTCVKGKQCRFPFVSTRDSERAKWPLELVHSDLCGPLEVASIGGSKYFLTFIDDFSHKVFVYFLKSKCEVVDKFKEFRAFVENQSCCKIKKLRTDNGKEYVNNMLLNVIKSAGIKHESTIDYTPQQNGIAERFNRTLVEKVRCMLTEANLGKEFWAEATNTAVHIVNRLSTRVLSDKTPEEAWSNKKPDISHFRTFGCRALTHIPKEKRKKLDAKSMDCLLMGYCENSKGYRLYNPSTKKFLKSRDVIFNEQEFLQKNRQIKFESRQLIPITEEVIESPSVKNVIVNDSSDESIESSEEVDETSMSDELFEDAYPDADDSPDDTPIETEIRTSKRIPKPRSFPDFYTYHVAFVDENPITVEEALNSNEKNHWYAAMEQEMKSFEENNTWSLVQLPKGKKAIDVKWVFKKKVNSDGQTERYKSRLVAKGCAQRKGIDYTDTFSPVVRHNSLRILFGLSVKYDMEIDHLDAVSAFLQGELEEDIYVKQPKAFGLEDDNEMVYKLNKAIYGLKQSGRAWNLRLDQKLKEVGLHQSGKDACVYYQRADDKLLIISVYVDDILIFSNWPEKKEEIKSKLLSQFKMKDLGPIQTFLGVRVTRDRKNKRLWLDQSNYIEKILHKFNMQDCHAVKTPVDVNVRLDKANLAEEDGIIPYQEAIGSIMYLCQLTRPDLCYAVGLLSRFNNSHDKTHWSAVKRVFRYLKGTANLKLEFSSGGDGKLIGYSDADWGNDSVDRKSVTGYTFLFQNCAVSWNSRKQPTVALSTTEAEYMAMAAATQELIWMRDFVSEFSPELLQLPIDLYCDNKGAIDLSNTGHYKARTKHIDVKHHFLKQKIEDKIVQIRQITTNDMLADIFTKPLAAPRFNDLANNLGLR